MCIRDRYYYSCILPPKTEKKKRNERLVRQTTYAWHVTAIYSLIAAARHSYVDRIFSRPPPPSRRVFIGAARWWLQRCGLVWCLCVQPHPCWTRRLQPHPASRALLVTTEKQMWPREISHVYSGQYFTSSARLIDFLPCVMECIYKATEDTPPHLK